MSRIDFIMPRLCSLISVSAELDVAELRHAENIGEEFLGEADAAGANNGNLEAAHAVLVAGRLAGKNGQGKINAPDTLRSNAFCLPVLPVDAAPTRSSCSVGGHYAYNERGRQRGIVLSWVILC